MLRAVTVLCSLGLCVAAFGQSITYTHGEYPSKGFPGTQADMNGDGILDMVTTGTGPTGKVGFYVTLSNPDGSYQTPAFYTSPYNGGTGNVVLGDFNRDGKVDAAEVEQTSSYYIFLNKGDGTLLRSWNFSTGQGTLNINITTADFNHDGKLDLVIMDGLHTPLQFLYGHGDGTFSAPVLIPTDGTPISYFFIGDYDADGNADLATTWSHCDRGVGCKTYVRVRYGDGKGGFSAPTAIDYDLDYQLNWSDDVNSDGRSDIYGYYSGNFNSLRILYGNKNRTFTARDVTPANIAYGPQAVDLNGDAIKDLAVIENVSGSPTVAVMLGKPDGSYQPEQFIYSNAQLVTLLAGRYDRDTKPDLMAWQALDGSYYDGNFEFLHNTTTGHFPSCAPPNAAKGIAVCSPANGGTVSSPVKFNVGAAFTSPLRKTELWIDGVKRKESFNSYAMYSFLKGSFKLGPGSHRADIYSATYDNLLQHVTVNFTVH